MTSSQRRRTQLNTSVSRETREKLDNVAQERLISLSEAIDQIVYEWSNNAKYEVIEPSNEAVDQRELGRRLERIETALKYMNFRLGVMPCWYHEDD